MHLESVANPWMWLGFAVVVVIALALDLGLFGRSESPLTTRQALMRTGGWTSLAVLFGAWVWHRVDATRGLEFYTGYVIEQALSVDNVFVFLVLFGAFRVGLRDQQRVLFWGIVGAVFFRGVFILAGAALVQKFDWLLLVFGAFLVYTGAKLLGGGDDDDEAKDPHDNPIVKLVRRVLPIHAGAHHGHFTTMVDGKRMGTMLLVILIAVEGSDILFALDSVPAIFAITTDPFIVFTSNIFAILGLRSLFFLVAGAASKFSKLKVGLSLVLVFIGLKMVAHNWVHVPIGLSLAIVFGLLGGAIVWSIIDDRRTQTSDRIEAAKAEKPFEGSRAVRMLKRVREEERLARIRNVLSRTEYLAGQRALPAAAERK